MDPEEKGYAWLFDDGGGTGDAASDECGCEGKPRWAIGDVHAGGADASGLGAGGGDVCGRKFVFGRLVGVPVGCGEPAGADVHEQHAGEFGCAEPGVAVWV